jgi:cytidylate kinase
MSIVAISQTLGSWGDEIGRTLAKALACEFADREIILQAAERFGEGTAGLYHITEERPTLWERVAQTQRHYRTYVEAIIWELAARDNVVLMGRGSVFVLQKIRHALRVRITASERVRAQRVHKEAGLADDLALDRVRQSGRERAARIKFLYGVDWG